jgi:hypothetical protein
MPWIERCGEVTNFGAVHWGVDELWRKVHSMCPFTSRTLKPTLDQSVDCQWVGGQSGGTGEEVTDCADWWWWKGSHVGEVYPVQVVV